MFGHDDNQPKNDLSTSTQSQVVEPSDSNPATATDASVAPEPVAEEQTVSLGAPTVVEPSKAQTDSSDPVSGAPEIDDQNDTSATVQDNTVPTTPADTSYPVSEEDPAAAAQPASEIDETTPAPTLADLEKTAAAEAATATATASASQTGVDLNNLLTIKQEALGELSPLVDHLEQTPDEKFHTTMMMIQASDDKSLIQKAFKAAQQITDDKERAQALLDIINEINYFTQQNSSEQ